MDRVSHLSCRSLQFIQSDHGPLGCISDQGFKMLQEKVELLDLLKEKKTFAPVAHHYAINESTVRYIHKQEATIKSAAAAGLCESAKKGSTIRNKIIVRMESALALWITDCRKKYSI
uniref:HTH psq-type domain-containing protein n=1 Tax=Monopterus albus TaxID=43700 RepID=A0A3Q3R4P9_MONAL